MPSSVCRNLWRPTPTLDSPGTSLAGTSRTLLKDDLVLLMSVIYLKELKLSSEMLTLHHCFAFFRAIMILFSYGVIRGMGVDHSQLINSSFMLNCFCMDEEG